MSLIIVGYKEVKYTSKKTGLLVEGVKLYCESVEKNTSNIVGTYVEEIYISLSKFNVPVDIDILGKYVECLYNRFGGIERVILS